jgi:hypothetical protein
MAKNRFDRDGSILRPSLSFSGGSNRGGESPRKDGQERKETPEEMIRSLQGIFCKGRYRSWTARQE